MHRIPECLHRGLAKAVLAAMGHLFVVLVNPLVQIGQKLTDTIINLLSESHTVELIKDGFVESFAYAV